MRWTPEKVASLRKRYGERQEDFCKRLGVTIQALRHWEQGLRIPSGPAAMLLDQLEASAPRAPAPVEA